MIARAGAKAIATRSARAENALGCGDGQRIAEGAYARGTLDAMVADQIPFAEMESLFGE